MALPNRLPDPEPEPVPAAPRSRWHYRLTVAFWLAFAFVGAWGLWRFWRLIALPLAGFDP